MHRQVHLTASPGMRSFTWQVHLQMKLQVKLSSASRFHRMESRIAELAKSENLHLFLVPLAPRATCSRSIRLQNGISHPTNKQLRTTDERRVGGEVWGDACALAGKLLAIFYVWNIIRVWVQGIC